MSSPWVDTPTYSRGGRFQLILSGHATNKTATKDATFVRGVPTDIGSFSDADPFGDAALVVTLPAITPFDDLDSPELRGWCSHFASADLWWIWAIPFASQYSSSELIVDPITNKQDLITPAYLRDGSGNITGWNRVKLWEGFIADMAFQNDQLQLQCQGANFQIDRYLAKPFYPSQPWPLEKLVEEEFRHLRRPHLRTFELVTRFPSGWKLVIPPYKGTTPYTPPVQPGTKWSGYTSRETGGWDHSLTSYIQNLLSNMITDSRSGVTPGNGWTVMLERETETSTGRQPVLQIRDRFRAADFTLQYGSRGVVCNLEADSTQLENMIYGDGTGTDGTGWRNAVISTDGSRTDYLPLAAARDVWPIYDNDDFDRGAFVSEARTAFGSGFDQSDAINYSEQALARDRQVGWTGSITLTVDPSPTLPRWMIQSGMTLRLKGFLGTGDTGYPLHIASTSKSPMDGSVQLTVDSRYRDLLTVEEARSRTRDPLTPVKMLQVGKASAIIQDVQAPWDYNAGSGFIPRESQKFFAQKPATVGFPYVSYTQGKFPPSVFPQYYVKVNAADPRSYNRWSKAVPILTSESGTIIRTELFCVNLYGEPVKAPFHLSFYKVNITPDGMPRVGVATTGPSNPLADNFSPFQNNAFEKTDPTTGFAVTPTTLWPPESIIVGWGNMAGGQLNRAGFWPGRETLGSLATGLFVDEGQWSYDNSFHEVFQSPLGTRAQNSDISIYAMIYAEWNEPLYFMGRLFRQNPGN